jgi:hypothetical protein
MPVYIGIFPILLMARQIHAVKTIHRTPPDVIIGALSRAVISFLDKRKVRIKMAIKMGRKTVALERRALSAR